MAAIPTNPYVAGNPVGNTDAFVGREDVQREVLSMLRHPQQNAITLYGQRRIGKTSVLQSLHTLLPKEGNYLPVFFDLEDKAALPMAQVLSELARVMAHELGLPTPELGNDPESAFKRQWIPGLLASIPVKSSIVLLFDEFDVLADPKAGSAAAAFFPYLKDLLALDRVRLQFVFVLGRSPNDLSSIALSVFKGIGSQRISLLSRENAEKLIRLSERDKSLLWGKEAIQAIWQLTHGHPFLTQALCSKIWDRAQDSSGTHFEVTAQDVQDAVEMTLESSRNTMEWLWDGLGPAERIVAAALAQAGPMEVDEISLERILQEGGVRIIIRELQNAPRLLQDWDLLEPAKQGYQFRVELLRHWIEENRPLKRVQQEIDRVQPRAENLYNVAVGYYEDDDAKEAENMLLQSLRANPSHIRANDLLAELLITQGRFDEAQKLLEGLLEIAPSVARPRLVQIYLAAADRLETDADRLPIFEKILELDSAHPRALDGRQQILVNLELANIRILDAAGRIDEAMDLLRRLEKDFPNARPDGESWSSFLKTYEIRTQLEQNYQLARSALDAGNKTTAIKHALAVLMIDVSYKDTTALLHEAVTGDSIEQLKRLPEKYYTTKLTESDGSRDEPAAPQMNLQREDKSMSVIRASNPVHQFRALSWAYLSPTRLQQYADEHYDHQGIVEAASWAASHLMWLPVLLLFTALNLGTSALAQSSVSSELTRYMTIPVLLAAMLSWLANLLKSPDNFRSIGYFMLQSVLAGMIGLSLLFGIFHALPGNILVGCFILATWTFTIVAAYIKTSEKSAMEVNQSGNRGSLNHRIGDSAPHLLTIFLFVVASLTLTIGFVTLRSSGGALDFLAGLLSPLIVVYIFTASMFRADKAFVQAMTNAFAVGVLLTLPYTAAFYFLTQRTLSNSVDSFFNVLMWNWVALFGFVLLSALIGLIGSIFSRTVWLTRLAFVLLLTTLAGLSAVLFVDIPSVLNVDLGLLTPATPTSTSSNLSTTRSADQMQMMQIPTATVVMGKNRTADKYTVSLSSYWIDKTEVTNSMYTRCFQSGKCTLPRDTTYFYDASYEDHPVVFVNWDQARTYCSWAGARLPTEAEWEFAAKGVDAAKHPWPWGSIWECSKANSSQNGCDGYSGTAPVGSYPQGASPFGVLDMSGNAYEWVQDWYAVYPVGSYVDMAGPGSGNRKVLRGGSVHDTLDLLTTTSRTSASALASAYNFGFRCADSVIQ